MFPSSSPRERGPSHPPVVPTRERLRQRFPHYSRGFQSFRRAPLSLSRRPLQNGLPPHQPRRRSDRQPRPLAVGQPPSRGSAYRDPQPRFSRPPPPTGLQLLSRFRSQLRSRPRSAPSSQIRSF